MCFMENNLNEKNNLLLELVEIGLKVLRAQTTEKDNVRKTETLTTLNLSLSEALNEAEAILLRR